MWIRLVSMLALAVVAGCGSGVGEPAARRITATMQEACSFMPETELTASILLYGTWRDDGGMSKLQAIDVAFDGCFMQAVTTTDRFVVCSMLIIDAVWD